MVNIEDDMDNTKLTVKDNIKVQTFVFDNSGKRKKNEETSGGKLNLWQLIPASLAYLGSFSFGIMVGWSSPIFPQLLPDDADIPITMDQTALIAGFLMIGNMFGVLPAHFMSFSTKYGMMIGVILMPIGWFVMWHGGSIFSLLASRFLIGFGNGLGSHHAKEYIKQMTDPPLRDKLVKSAAIYAGLGTLLGFTYGAHADFRTYSVISFFVTAVPCVVCIFLPQSPLELVKMNKIADAKVLLRYLKPEIDPDGEINKLRFSIENEITDYGSGIIKCRKTINNFIISMFLIFFQQCTGAQSSIIFCLVILNKFELPNANILAIIYIIIYLITLVINNCYISKFNMKHTLLISSVFTSVFLILNSLIIYFSVNEKWVYLPYFCLVFFNISHTVGLFPVPFALVPKLFPKPTFITHVQTIFFSIWVIIVTKMFQLLITYHELYAPFLFFGVAAILASVFIWIFIPNPDDLKQSHLVPNMTNSDNVNNKNAGHL